MITPRRIHVAANDNISFFLGLSNIPSCVYVYVCVCVCLCVHTHHLFLIHPSVDGRLGCAYVLAIVKSVAMNTGVRVSLQIIVLSRYVPRSGISGSYGSSMFSFFKEPPYSSP